MRKMGNKKNKNKNENKNENKKRKRKIVVAEFGDMCYNITDCGWGSHTRDH